MLDVSFGDDANRARTGHAARALHAIRNTALNLARRFDQSTPNLCRQHALKPNLLINRLRIFKNSLALPPAAGTLATQDEQRMGEERGFCLNRLRNFAVA